MLTKFSKLMLLGVALLGIGYLAIRGLVQKAKVERVENSVASDENVATPLLTPRVFSRLPNRLLADENDDDDDDDDDLADDENDVERADRAESAKRATNLQRTTSQMRGVHPGGLSDSQADSDSGTTAPVSNPGTSLLKSLEQAAQGNNDRIYGGRGAQVAGTAPAGATSPAETVPTPTPVPLPRVDGQARGYTLLYLMQPGARDQIEKKVTALLRAEIGTIYLGVLIDGTFSKSFDYLQDVLRRLSVGGRRVLLTLYLSNGPTQRDWATTVINAPFVKISPLTFRALILSDANIQAQFQRIVRDALEVFRYNLSLGTGNENIAVVMLEDNLDSRSYSTMRLLANNILRGTAQFYRNPCGCVSGADEDPQSDRREEHSVDKFNVLRPADGYSLDGVGYLYPGEASATAVAPEALEQMLDQSLNQRLRYFGLWRADRQGISDVINRLPPDQRTYPAPGEQELEFDIGYLRRGLIPVTSK